MPFEIHVFEGQQRQGLGRKLFQNLVALARIQGVSTLVHSPIKKIPAELKEKLQQFKWISIDYNESNEAVLTCHLQSYRRGQ